MTQGRCIDHSFAAWRLRAPEPCEDAGVFRSRMWECLDSYEADECLDGSQLRVWWEPCTPREKAKALDV